MNEFTKEELEWLLEEIGLSIQDYCQPDMAYVIRDKLKSMIDNYCEHENSKNIHPDDTVRICNTCETILSHWNLRKSKR